MTDDLARFIAERLDEDERDARAADLGPWQVVPELRATRSTLYGEADVSGPNGLVAYDSDGGCTSMANAEHIARHDPARALAFVAAGRAILEEARLILSVVAVDFDVRDEVEARRTLWEHDVLRPLATIWAGHADYREEWKP